MENWKQLGGYLLATQDSVVPKIAWVQEMPGIQERVKLSPDNWHGFTLYTTQKMISEEDTQDEYSYPIVMATSADRVLILSRNREVVEHLLERQPYHLNRHFSRFVVRLDHIVDHAIQSGADFKVTHIYAMFKRSSGAKSVSFSGDDITREDSFVSMAPRVDLLNCGIRRPSNSVGELLRMGRDSRIRFDVGSDPDAREGVFRRVQEALLFMRNKQSKDAWGNQVSWLELAPGHGSREADSSVPDEVRF